MAAPGLKSKAPAASLKNGPDCIALLPRDDIGSTLGVSLDRRFLDVVSPERTFTGVGAHYCVTGAIMSCGDPRVHPKPIATNARFRFFLIYKLVGLK